MKRVPTDRQILDEIYRRYYDTFASYSEQTVPRGTRIYVPIDFAALAEHFKVDPDIVFGRLYYDLEQRYGYTNEDGSKVHLFSLQAGSEVHCVHFPLLASVLARLQEDRSKHLWSVWLSIAALAISIMSLVVSAV